MAVLLQIELLQGLIGKALQVFGIARVLAIAFVALANRNTR